MDTEKKARQIQKLLERAINLLPETCVDFDPDIFCLISQAIYLLPCEVKKEVRKNVLQ